MTKVINCDKNNPHVYSLFISFARTKENIKTLNINRQDSIIIRRWDQIHWNHYKETREESNILKFAPTMDDPVR